jgi:hypothetical protein
MLLNSLKQTHLHSHPKIPVPPNFYQLTNTQNQSYTDNLGEGVSLLPKRGAFSL